MNVFKKYILYANLMGRAQANTTDILKVPEMHRFALHSCVSKMGLTPADWAKSLWSLSLSLSVSYGQAEEMDVFFRQKHRGHVQRASQ